MPNETAEQVMRALLSACLSMNEGVCPEMLHKFWGAICNALSLFNLSVITRRLALFLAWVPCHRVSLA
jgi:hypothetical protein